MLTSFCAIDFETADHRPESACAVGIAAVVEGLVVERVHALICPPPSDFRFSTIHRITADDVADEPPFAVVWRRVQPLLDNAAFLAAHNASFDRRVLQRCCAAAGLRPPSLRFVCTLHLARRVWRLSPARLPDVCRHLGIALRHHDALSDAEACARIVIAAESAGATIAPT